MQRYEALLKVLEMGSFTTAGQVLGFSQSAISKMISSLEEELEIRLISRSRYGIRLTPEGSQLLPFIRSAVGQYRSMLLAAEGLRETDTGEIRIGAVASITHDWLIPLVGRFWELYPGIHFDIKEEDYSTIADMVRSGQLDLGFVNEGASAGLNSVFLKKDEFLLALPKGHPLAGKDRILPEDLQNERFLMVSDEHETYNEVISVFSDAGVWPDIVLHAHSDSTILSMVEKGYGISILSERIIRSGHCDIVSRSFHAPVLRSIYIVTREPALVPIAGKRFLRYVTDHAADLI